MNIFRALAALVLALCVAAPASARDAFVQDGGGLFDAATVSNLNNKISDFNRTTGKEVVVVTVPSLNGETAQVAAEKAFAQQQVNGVMIFLAKAEKKDGVVGDRASRAFFPAGSFDSIRQAMRGYFRQGDFNTGITTGVDLVLNDYRGHESSLRGAGTRHRELAPTARSSSFGGGMSIFWLILILIAGFLIIRAIFKAMSRPKMMPPGYGGQPGYGQPGYGQGPGYNNMGGGGMMGGGGFFSGLLGGLGGAFLGNELFGRHDGGGYGGDQAGFGGSGEGGASGDASGWQSDAGQADAGNASFGDYGSSGGGFDAGGGGGGFDSGGGGGGDSGGGW